MATYTKIKLSSAGTINAPICAFDGVNYGAPVNIHTTGTSSTVLDEVWLWAWSKYNSDMALDFEIAGVTTFSSNHSVYANGINTPQLIIPGFIIAGTGSAGTSIKVIDQQFSGNAYIFGYVNRITP